MIDAYTHLDVGAPDPVAELGVRMMAAGVQHAVVVETWAGTESRCLDVLAADAGPGTSVIRCVRDDISPTRLDDARVTGWRVATTTLADARRAPLLLDRIAACGGVLVAHAEHGVAALASVLCPLVTARPSLEVWVPHLAWPWPEDIVSGAWRDALARVREVPNVQLIVSALPTFSRQAWPHDDVQALAHEAARAFGSGRRRAGSDFPHCGQRSYAECLRLAHDVIARAARSDEATRG